MDYNYVDDYYVDDYISLLWSINPGLGCISLEALVAFIVTLAVLFALVRRSKDWPEAIRLHVGLILLSAWLITHWIDESVNHVNPDVTPYFLIFSMLTHFARICSDVLVVSGLWRVYTRYGFLRLPKTNALFDNLFASLLWVLAGLHMVFLITTTGTLLANSNADEVYHLAEARSAFEVTYMAVQFCAMLIMSIWFYIRFDERETGADYYYEVYYIAHAALALLLRSFCEVIIVGQLDRDRSDVFDTQRARDVMYSLLSIYFVLVVTFAVPEKGIQDPLVIKDRSAVQEIKRLVEEKIAEVTDGGKNTAPTMSSVLDGIEATLEAQKIPPEGQQQHQMKLDEIARLRKLYGNWEPVYKDGSNTDGQKEVIELVKKNDRSAAEAKQTGLGRMITRLWPEKGKQKKTVRDGSRTAV